MVQIFSSTLRIEMDPRPELREGKPRSARKQIWLSFWKNDAELPYIFFSRAERGFPSRSSGLGSTSIRSVLEKIFTIQPSNKSYTITNSESTFFCHFVNFLFFWINPFVLVYPQFFFNFLDNFFPYFFFPTTFLTMSAWSSRRTGLTHTSVIINNISKMSKFCGKTQS